MDGYGNIQHVRSVDAPVSGDRTTGRHRRSRSFGSETEWNGYHDADYERQPYRSFSTDSIKRYSLQEQERNPNPKYVSSVYVKDDNFAINRVQVPGRWVDSNYPDGDGQRNPVFVSEGVGFQNPAFSADSDSHVGRISHPYLQDSSPMRLPIRSSRSYIDGDYSHEIRPSGTSIHPGEEKHGRVNVIYVRNDGDGSRSGSGRPSPRKISKSRVSPEKLERYDEEDGKNSAHSSPRKYSKNRVSPENVEMVRIMVYSQTRRLIQVRILMMSYSPWIGLCYSCTMKNYLHTKGDGSPSLKPCSQVPTPKFGPKFVLENRKSG